MISALIVLTFLVMYVRSAFESAELSLPYPTPLFLSV